MKLDTIPETVVVAPPSGVVFAHIAGVPIETWVLWLNLTYITLAIAWKLWSIYKESRDDRKRRRT